MRFPVTSSNGFSLVEVTLALGVASIGLATIVGLLSVGTGASQRAGQVSAAANLFSAVATDLRHCGQVSRQRICYIATVRDPNSSSAGEWPNSFDSLF